MQLRVCADWHLEVDKISKSFGGVVALSEASFRVQRGEIHAICGENGAGKSTLMKILSGVYEAGTYEGRICLDGEEVHFCSGAIKAAIERGIAIVYQELMLVPRLTVAENVFLGREEAKHGIIDWPAVYRATDQILKTYNISLTSSERLENLPVGKQQLVEIAKALSENAKILILDEPTSALTEKEIDTLMDILKVLKTKGITCLYITHKLEEVFRICDRVTVLRDGSVVDTCPVNALSTNQLVSLMVGREMNERFPARDAEIGEVVLSVRDLWVEHPDINGKMVTKEVSFNLHAGEVLGIAGLMGSGRSELVTALFGEYGRVHSGKVFVKGQEVNIRSAKDAVQKKIGLVPEDRKKLGLILKQSIRKNMSLPSMMRFASLLKVDQMKELRSCEELSEAIRIKAPNLLTPVESLSGGNQQKVVIAKWLMTEPNILILDDPTRGIDVGAKYEIYNLINTLASQGVGIVMISSELDELLGMSDRVMVIHEGEAMGILDREKMTKESIMRLATGLRSE